MSSVDKLLASRSLPPHAPLMSRLATCTLYMHISCVQETQAHPSCTKLIVYAMDVVSPLVVLLPFSMEKSSLTCRPASMHQSQALTGKFRHHSTCQTLRLFPTSKHAWLRSKNRWANGTTSLAPSTFATSMDLHLNVKALRAQVNKCGCVPTEHFLKILFFMHALQRMRVT